MAASERLILYSAPMVRAYLEDRKTQTRRIVKRQPVGTPWYWAGDDVDPDPTWFDGYRRGQEPCGAATEEVNDAMHCPYGASGDFLRGKENAWIWCRKERAGLTKTGRPKYLYIPVGQHVIYQADHPGRPAHRLDEAQDTGWRLKIGRYLPKWACRMRSQIVSLRVERVQSISEADAKAEGVYSWALGPEGARVLDKLGVAACSRPRLLFELLWVSINGQESWDANPWVWVMTFKRVEAGD